MDNQQITDTLINETIISIEKLYSISPPLFGEKEVRCGKPIAYIGWFWRTVEFSRRIRIGHCLMDSFSAGGPQDFKGFMENNKWGYAEVFIKPGDKSYEEIIQAIYKLVPLYQDYISSCEKVAPPHTEDKVSFAQCRDALITLDNIIQSVTIPLASYLEAQRAYAMFGDTIPGHAKSNLALDQMVHQLQILESSQ